MHDWIWFCFNAQWKLKAMSLCVLVSVCDFSFVVEDFGVMVVKMSFYRKQRELWVYFWLLHRKTLFFFFRNPTPPLFFLSRGGSYGFAD